MLERMVGYSVIGSTYNKSDFPKLYEVCKGIYGGDSSTFRVPDFRGKFLRAYDDSYKKKAGELGSTQPEKFRSSTSDVASTYFPVYQMNRTKICNPVTQIIP